MDRLKYAALPTAFAASFLAVGVPYWLIPYRDVSLPDTLMATGMFVVGLAALLLRSCGIARIWKGIVGASMPAAVLARVIVDAAADPTSHNLWPLEIVVVLPLGFACAFVGAIVGTLLAGLAAGRAGDED